MARNGWGVPVPMAGFAVGVATLLAFALGPLTPVAGATTCPTAPWNELEVAHEIIDIGTVYRRPEEALPTYKGAGDNPIPDDVWNAGYEPPSPYIANTTRNLQFNESKFIASPGQPVCTTGYITTSDGYTWAAMSLAINAMWPYRPDTYTGLPSRNAYYAGNLVETPPPGVVKVTANFKGQDIKFWANENGVPPGTPGAVPLTRYFVRDRWGNEYVMHASGQDTPEGVAQAFRDAVLPKGWTKSKGPLDKDLVLRPAEGSDGSFHYLVIRDSADNTYHQLKWSDRGSLQKHVQGRAMPIWGGQDDNVLGGGPRADVIHGARGDDLIRPRLGTDQVWGDAGADTVVLQGNSQRYRLTRVNRRARTVVVAGFRAKKTIRYAERLRFRNKTVRIASLRRSDVGERL
jgi:hemolysin type calcium-binding protein